MSTSGLTIRHLNFTGPKVQTAALTFESGLNLLYGASNTGKSFTLKAIDFMLGASKTLPEFEERDGYDKLWFGFTLAGQGDFTLARSMVGGGFELHRGLISSVATNATFEKLSQTPQSKNMKSLSLYLLEHL